MSRTKSNFKLESKMSKYIRYKTAIKYQPKIPLEAKISVLSLCLYSDPQHLNLINDFLTCLQISMSADQSVCLNSQDKTAVPWSGVQYHPPHYSKRCNRREEQGWLGFLARLTPTIRINTETGIFPVLNHNVSWEAKGHVIWLAFRCNSEITLFLSLCNDENGCALHMTSQ